MTPSGMPRIWWSAESEAFWIADRQIANYWQCVDADAYHNGAERELPGDAVELRHGQFKWTAEVTP